MQTDFLYWLWKLIDKVTVISITVIYVILYHVINSHFYIIKNLFLKD